MKAELFYDEARSSIYGRVKDYKTIINFTKSIKEDPEACMLTVKSVEKKLCICTQSGLDPETIQPVELTDIEMEWYFIATVESNKKNNMEALPRQNIT